ncbi:hypothetical protein Egran_03694 [Elaphomyces granulatus]|uniref:Protein YTP1-like C-terminal domain-containing protein n=1 Tax=Elaphomyces granulatus TaxID=519963 RepID=A0A232LWI2_9EURO|nr:hypothetical protein Egran_03694 [Elaphomyces granulatus]
MWRNHYVTLLAAAVLFISITNGLPHDDHDPTDMTMGMGNKMNHSGGMLESIPDEEKSRTMSYFAYQKNVGTILAHIILMVLAWGFVLPIAVMFSIARSRYTIPTQVLFLVVNGLGLLFGIVYNSQTPDLYENNAHHKIGWIATWIVVAQVIIGIIYAYSGQGRDNAGVIYERAAFLPVPTEAVMESQQPYSTDAVHEYRWSGDSGQGTERNSASLRSCPSPTETHYLTPPDEFEHYGKLDEDTDDAPAPRYSFQNTILERFFSTRMPRLASVRVLRIFHVAYIIINRICLPFGFIAITTGGVTYGGIFRGDGVFSGLAHFIKGGIFFWYGLVILGRFMGCWAEFGWAWNVKPPRALVGKWKARIPTGEFMESFLIFLYGSTNVFLEHLAAWGQTWSAIDLQHISISIMFFGGGLCGMLLESRRVREWLNKTVIRSSSHSPDLAWRVPDTQTVSLNPMPALIILLLGTMMGSHHQAKMISSMVHKQWGMLLAGGALARVATYILLYVKPPISYLPSRPPSEVVAAFCLISGGLIFMLSASDIINVMDYYQLDAMFTFNVAMGLTAFIMAWEILAIAIKAWAANTEAPPRPSFRFSA